MRFFEKTAVWAALNGLAMGWGEAAGAQQSEFVRGACWNGAAADIR
jgi:hypothetical protein